MEVSLVPEPWRAFIGTSRWLVTRITRSNLSSVQTIGQQYDTTSWQAPSIELGGSYFYGSVVLWTRPRPVQLTEAKAKNPQGLQSSSFDNLRFSYSCWPMQSSVNTQRRDSVNYWRTAAGYKNWHCRLFKTCKPTSSWSIIMITDEYWVT